jgi:large subunit ribosomal protein L22
MSPQKTRLVVDQIRGKRVEEALSILRFSPRAAAREIEKLLRSAVANAEQREERVDVDRLRVSRAAVDPGPSLKRVRFRAMGRAFRILKRSCHVSLELDLDGARRPAGPAAPAPAAPAGSPAPAAPRTAPARRRGAGKKAAGGARAAGGAAKRKPRASRKKAGAGKKSGKAGKKQSS